MKSMMLLLSALVGLLCLQAPHAHPDHGGATNTEGKEDRVEDAFAKLFQMVKEEVMKLPENEEEQEKGAFRALDYDKDDKISKNDMVVQLKKYIPNVTKEELVKLNARVDKWFEQYGKVGNATLSFEEYFEG